MAYALRSDKRANRGVTLVELMVALAVLGIMAGVVGLTAVVQGPAPVTSYEAKTIAAARQKAIATASPVSVQTSLADDSKWVLALPDGSIIGASPLGFDPLSGRTTASRFGENP
jgi:prepilin-type N-terminal cleavage/methylation domain-containing protein